MKNCVRLVLLACLGLCRPAYAQDYSWSAAPPIEAYSNNENLLDSYAVGQSLHLVMSRAAGDPSAPYDIDTLTETDPNTGTQTFTYPEEPVLVDWALRYRGVNGNQTPEDSTLHGNDLDWQIPLDKPGYWSVQGMAFNDSSDTPAARIDEPVPGTEFTFYAYPSSYAIASSPWQGGTDPDGDPVDLAHGAEDYTMGSDVTAYNPNGPDAAFQRTYHSRMAQQNQGAAGLTPGWTTNYDVVIRPFYNDEGITISYPNGSYESSNLIWQFRWLAGQWEPVSYTFSHVAGAPYLVSGTLRGSIYLIWKNRTQWQFDWDDQLGYYTLDRITDHLGHSIHIHRSLSTDLSARGRVESISDDSDQPLLTFQYGVAGYPYQLASVTDRAGRTVSYSYATDAATGATVLAQVSQVGQPATAYRNAYEYASEGGQLYLARVTRPDPTGTGTLSTTISYADTPDSTGLYRVARTQDDRGVRREYQYVAANEAYTVPDTGCPINGPATVVKVTKERANEPGVFDTFQTFVHTFDTTTYLPTGSYEDGRSTRIVYGTNTYDRMRPVQVTDRNGRTTSVTWDQYGNVTGVKWPSTAPSGLTKTKYTYTYSASGFPYLQALRVQTGDASLLDSGANPSANLKAPTVVSFDPDYGLVTSVQAPLPGTVGSSGRTTTSFGYDTAGPRLGNLQSITMPRPDTSGGTTTITLDYTDATHTTPAKGQVRKVTVPQTSTQSVSATFDWNADGTLKSRSDALGYTTSFGYDAARRLTQIVYPAVQSGTYAPYTILERGSANPVVGGPVTGIYAYDEGTDPGRPYTAAVQYGYDLIGQLATVTGDTEPLSLDRDELGRASVLRDGRQDATAYAYTKSDALSATSVAYPGNAVQGGGYDTASASESHPVVNCDTTGAYNSVVSATDGRGITKTLSYLGPDGELTDVQYAGHADDNLHYTYDLYGRVASIRHGASDTSYQDLATYAYDDRNDVLTATTTYSGVPAKTLTYSYYPDGSRASLAVSDLAQPFSYTYNLAGQMTGLTNPQGQSFTWAYDTRGLLSHQQWQDCDTAYGYDGRGRLVSSVMQDWSGTYTNLPAFTEMRYDALGNLTHYRYEFSAYGSAQPSPALSGAAVQPAAAAPYGYVDYTYAPSVQTNPYGLLYHESRSGYVVYDGTYAYDAAYNPTVFQGVTLPGYNGDNQRTDTAYDGNGNPQAHVFDVENRLAQYNGATAMQFGYNGFGLRAWKQPATDPTKRHYYLYDGSLPLVDFTTGGDLYLSTYGPNGLVAIGYSGPHGLTNPLTVYGFDPSGNLAVTIRPAYTSPVTPYVCDAFGTRLTGSGPGFAGQWGASRDSETGLVLMGHRYYDPSTGRFLTRDPIGYNGGINLYAYCKNNPANLVDPLGTEDLTEEEIEILQWKNRAMAGSYAAPTGAFVAEWMEPGWTPPGEESTPPAQSGLPPQDPSGSPPQVSELPPGSGTFGRGPGSPHPGPYGAKPGDLPVGPDGNLIPQTPDNPTGISGSYMPGKGPMHGWFYPYTGGPLPDGMTAFLDGPEYMPDSPHSEGHISFCATNGDQDPEAFNNTFLGLPWGPPYKVK